MVSEVTFYVFRASKAGLQKTKYSRTFISSSLEASFWGCSGVHALDTALVRSSESIEPVFYLPRLEEVPNDSTKKNSDTLTSSSVVYQWQEDVENLEPYRSGGYHPTHINDCYHNNRYEIVHKLGSGSYSTVWLAKDHHENRFVALKIVAAEFSARE